MGDSLRQTISVMKSCQVSNFPSAAAVRICTQFTSSAQGLAVSTPLQGASLASSARAEFVPHSPLLPFPTHPTEPLARERSRGKFDATLAVVRQTGREFPGG